MMKLGHIFIVAVLAAVLMSQARAAENDGVPSDPLAKALPSLDDLTATRERPLFSPSRRPPAEPVERDVPAPIAETAAFPFELVGVVMGPDIRIAILRKSGERTGEEVPAAGEEVHLKIGETLADWTVEEIAGNYVVLHGKTKRVRLRLFKEKVDGIQVGRRGGEPDKAPGEESDPADKEFGAKLGDKPDDETDDPADKEPGDPAAVEQSGQVDEEIVPTSPPKAVPPTARKVVPPPARPGQARGPVRPGQARPPGTRGNPARRQIESNR